MHRLAAAFLAAAPAAHAMSMCCVGDWSTAPGPYANFDTSTNTEEQNRDEDIGCATCCQPYGDSTLYGREGTDLIFEVKDSGTFTAGYGTGGGAVAGGATLEVQFSQRQVRLSRPLSSDDGEPLEIAAVYKESKFDPSAWADTCRPGHDPGFRFGAFQSGTYFDGICGLNATAWQELFCNDGAYIDHSDGESCATVLQVLRDSSQACDMLPSEIEARSDIEFEQDMTWKDFTTGAVLGQAWGMQKVFIGEQTVLGYRDTRCFHTSSANLTGCTDAMVSPNGLKFQLELNQQDARQNLRYPAGSTDFWDACEVDGGTNDTCATCFAVAVAVDKGSLAVESYLASTSGTVAAQWLSGLPDSTTPFLGWLLGDAATGDEYTFMFPFENLYNRNSNGNGVNAPSDFAKGAVVANASEESGVVYVCAPRSDFDITSTDRDKAFLYDPQVITKKTSSVSPSPPLLPPPSPPPPSASPSPPPPSASPSPSPSPPIGTGTGDPCFPSSATVQTADGEVVPVSSLSAGDSILAAAADGTLRTLVHDTVSSFSLADPSAKAVFLSLATATATVTLTPTHKLPAGPAKALKKASKVAVGETIWLASPAAGALAPVLEITEVVAEGLHSPLTKHGGWPVVDGVATSYNSAAVVARNKYLVPLVEVVCPSLARLVVAAANPKAMHYIDGEVVEPLSSLVAAVAVAVGAVFAARKAMARK
ncbi:hypothetical protein EMIHUDRAFT_116672 [Emiliania huxleyi CCMP1516]|uniref:Hint domain-containing protein n=2 Tax=Emiliania huxleyi TaxID=2903 RepID=A0A0D3JGE4_EMIH1|nr:hypothetical protein EMIHUDRAFT_116672 [Emiliania huxleyi CCMP1516]EOD22579.1 hypothetical protein EMIHUDRAFT_116672 [Emiliania huxleyi CCMP1516]|eukprot:XP_005775008.1 hypothetical protein EMIHUDRAFT_116672 [Emiliania huxleyi CCMP1516]